MSRHIPHRLRQFVAERANFRCEYCKIAEQFSFFNFHVEHIISVKHGGQTTKNNLAYACPICNYNKGTDIATLIPDVVPLVRFFNPRLDTWEEHFSVAETGELIPLTFIAMATINILKLNHPDAVIERKILLKLNLI
ncbi:MAG TPA: HNH endonuclease signature motif containing protein [Chitinophagales bacterium]|nr:HNH endonuclease signature motif containing protein [Chitinophagales bacterium]